MKTLKTIALVSALSLGAIWTQVADAGAASLSGVFAEINASAPRSEVFADLNKTAPRADVFGQINETAPRADVFADLNTSAPRSDGVYGQLEVSAP